MPLVNKIFKMLLKGTTLNSAVPLPVMVETILLRFRTGWIVQEWIRTLHSGLALDGGKTWSIENFSGVKSASVLKTQSRLCEGFGFTSLWVSCPRLCP